MRARLPLYRTGRHLLVLATIAIPLLGCKSRGAAHPSGKGTAPPPVTAAALAPVFGTLGPQGTAPQRLVIELARPIAGPESKEEVGASAFTRFAVVPAIDGELRRGGPSTLAFVPSKPFRPGVTYTFTLVSVKTPDGRELHGPGAGWQYQFSTPAFGLARVALADSEASGDWVDLDLVFSAPVDLDGLQQRVHVAVVDRFQRDAPLGLARVQLQAANVVRVRAVGAALKGRRTLHLVLDAGVRDQSGEAKAPAARDEVQLPEGEAVSIKALYPVEGASGFYLELVCSDGAVSERRYYYDAVSERGFGELSTRCQFSPEQLAERLRIEPAVPFTSAPSGGGVRLFGDFKRGPYSVRLVAGSRTIDGGVLHGDFETSFSVPARSPQVTFIAKGRYLPRSAWRSLPVRHLNVDRVTLEVRQVPPRNLVFWMSNDDSEAADERTSDLILKREIPVHGNADAVATTYLDVAAWVPAETKGLLELTVRAATAHDTARLLLTDLQVVAKRTGMAKPTAAGRSIHVWAFDSKTLAAARGVEVKLLRKSGFVLATCSTVAGGDCELAVPQTELDTSAPFALLASDGKDVTYLKFAELQAAIEETRVAGEPYGGDRRYRAAVYEDRGVYRPGDTAHVVAIVRDSKHHAPPAGMPVQVKLIDSRGKLVRQRTLAVNAAGVVTFDPSFGAFAPTGRYEAQIEIGGQAAGSDSFRVEEFVPERMKVEAKTASPQYLLGGEVKVGIAARYLFGGMPAGAKVELTCELAPATFSPPANANFVYGVWREEQKQPEKAVPLGAVQGVLDAAGEATLACPAVGSAGSFRGPAAMVARAAVFEAGSGRTTVGEARVPVHPERYYVGLASTAQKARAGEDLVVQGVVVDWNGKLVTDVPEVQVELVRLEEEYGWYYDENRGQQSWRRYLRPTPEDRTQAAIVGGRFRLAWKPLQDAAAYLITARAGGARTDLEVPGDGGWYYWRPEETEAQRTPRPDRATWIELAVPAKAQVGQPVSVDLQMPFRGRVLLTAETDELVASEWRDAQPGKLSWTFALDRFVPNVYVTAFAVKDPRVSKDGGLLPDRAFGVQSVAVEPAEFTQPVRLHVPNEVRSASRLGVDLDLGNLDGPTFATVAAVDEGILSLTKFPSPDPARQIFTRRALGVQTFETVGWTLAVPPASHVGGDAAGKLGRVQPVKPVALWSGLLAVPASGKLHVELPLPAYRGALRVMAVAAGPKRLGHADAQVVVRDPLVLQVTLPRFLALHDAIDVPVAVTNLSGKPQLVVVDLAAQDLAAGGLDRPCGGTGCAPLVAVKGPAKQRLTLAPGATGNAVFHAQASGGLGGVALVARARAGDLRSEERAELPVLPAGPRVRTVQRLELTAGTTDLAPHLKGWLPLTERTTVWVTANPYGDAFAHLSELVHYPYGCIEQTSSTTRPLLYLSHLVGSLDSKLAQPGAIEAMVQAGIDRILSMQTPAGGFGYWPGADEPTPWGSAYATHVLLDAQRLRYPMPQGRIDDALGWMEQRVASLYERGGTDYSWEHHTAEPYMHYVLALAGRGRKARILHLIEQSPNNPRHEEREELYMLKAALYLAGDHRFERDLRHPDISPLDRYRENSWSFYSDLRMRGFMLSVFVDLFGQDPGATRLAQLVAEGLKSVDGSYYTTQELAWGTTGLGKFLEAGARDFAPPVLVADGRRLAPAPAPAGGARGDRSWELPRASEYGQLAVTLAEKDEGKLFLILVSEGVRAEGGAPYGGEGLRLERRWLDSKGEPLAGASTTADSALAGLALGDIVYVELTLSNSSGERMSNIALVDRVPAGWEIENPRLGRSDATPDWVDADRLWSADHLDLRDDRVEVFGHLERGEVRQVLYAVRAVTAGRFELPSAEAEAMYDPRNWARARGGTVEVKGPW